MADDPIKSFRERFAPRAPVPASPAPVANHTSERPPYEAFGTKDKVLRLDIRCAESGLAHAVPYGYLLNLTYNRRTYGEIFLTVSGLTVIVKGTNLRPLVDAIKLHTCEFIQEFDPQEFNEVTDPNAPYVTSIEVEVIRGSTPGSVNQSRTT